MILKIAFSSIKKKLILLKLRNKYKKNNRHNYTTLGFSNQIDNIIVGKETYGIINCFDYKDGCKLQIGSYCSLAREVFFLMGGNHNYKSLMTYPFESMINGIITSQSKGDIIVEDDVWIGFGCTILSGVKIGKGSIIGARTVVTKDVPPYSIFCGNPGKVVKYRFSDSIISKIVKLDLTKISIKNYEKYKSILNSQIDDENIEKIVDEFMKMED